MIPTAQTPQTLGYKTAIIFNGVPLPCMAGAALHMPRNIALPQPIGNYAALNWTEGFQMPTLDVQFLLRDQSGEVLNSSFLGYALNRLGDVSHDTTVLGNITYSDGRTVFTLYNCKFDSFVMSATKGAQIMFAARFVGNGLDNFSGTVSQTPFNAAVPLFGQRINFGNLLVNKVYAFNLSYTNNHNPDFALNGSVFPNGINAGGVACGMSVTAQVADVPNFPADNGSIFYTILGPSGATAVFTLPNVVNNTPFDRMHSMGREMLTYNYNCLMGLYSGAAAVASPNGETGWPLNCVVSGW